MTTPKIIKERLKFTIMKQKKLLFTLSLLALNAVSLVSCGGNTSGLASNSTNQSSQSTSLVSLSTTPNLSTSTST